MFFKKKEKKETPVVQEVQLSVEEVDQRIEELEAILAQDKSLGKNYNELMKMYNIKRRHAAEAKDEQQIQVYLNKIDALMQLSKDVIRGKV